MSRRKRNQERPRITGRGRGLAAASLIAIVAGMLAGSSVLVQLGGMGICTLLVARFWCGRNAARISVRRVLPPEVFSGQDFDIELELENRRRVLAARELRLADKLLPFHERGVAIESLSTGRSLRERFRTRIIGRGRIERISYRLESSFPCGLFTTTLRRRGKESILVYPRPVLPSALRAASYDSSHDDSGAASELDNQGELRGVREFQRGDRLKQVMWPIFARSGKLVVREFDRPLPERYTLLFHSYCPPGKLIWPEAFEHALSLLAGLLFMGRDHRVPMEIRAPFTNWQPFEVRDPQKLGKPLELLAMAAHAPASDLSAVSSALSSLQGTHPVFVISEAPVQFWADQLPPVGRTVTCLDTIALKVKPPALAGFRRVGTAAA